MDLSPTFSGSFTSDGLNKFIPLEIGCDWFKTINYSTVGSGGGAGIMYFWNRGMAQGTAAEIKASAAATTLVSAVKTTGGFWYQDTSLSPLGPLYSDFNPGIVAATRIATIVATVDAHNIGVGSVVRLYNMTSALQLSGYDFTVTVAAAGGNTFTIGYMVNFTANATGGSYRVINFDPLYYPRHRSVVSVTKAVNPTVVFSVTHGYTVGQQLRFTVPAKFGMVELNGLTANVLSVNTATNAITIDVDTTAFTTFAFPLTAMVPFTPAQATPIGEGLYTPSVVLPHDLLDATYNTGQTGMLLYGGVNSPAGLTGNVIYWEAGKSANI